MIPVLAAVAVMLAPGCRALGGAVRCELADATPLPVATRSSPPPPLPAPVPIRRPRRVASRPPDEAEIGRRLLSLTSIGDCTGARTLLVSIGREDQAHAAFDRCIGAAPPPR